MAHKEKDALTGTETTGHEWDGIKELNTPLPRWWIYTLYVTVIWAVGYWVVYPSWPTLDDFAKGAFGYSSRAALASDLQAQATQRAPWREKFTAKPVDEIAKDPELLNYAMAGGKIVFGDNCAPCHGPAGSGAPGYPILADDDWLWGGTLDAIETTIRHGIRSGHEQARNSEMPNFAGDSILTPDQIQKVADFVMSLSGQGAANPDGRILFAENCSACHGEDGKGMAELGGPNLSDNIWLYGKGRPAVTAQVAKPKHGVMPAWQGRLDDVSIKQAAIYVHSLGGGK